MTLLLAIQTEDSVIVSADNRVVTIDSIDQLKTNYHSDRNKLYLWDGGVVTGSGEAEIPKKMRAWLQQNNALDLLPEKLNQIKKQRIIESSACYEKQINNSQVVFSVMNKSGFPQLYILGLQKTIIQAEPKTLSVFFPLDGRLLMSSIAVLQKLEVAIRQYHEFTDHEEWIDHYIGLLAHIYTMVSQGTHQVSASFDVFFESKSYRNIIHCQNDKIK